jgi:putative NADH-flavin reductase
MRILVLGASGGTGQQVVEQALAHGLEVVAFVRDAGRLPFVHERLKVIAGDVSDPVAVQTAVEGCDAVISTLGSRGQRPVTVYSDGIANTIRAMTARGIRRLVVVSAAGAGNDSPDIPVRVRLTRKMPGLRPVYEDMERMEGDVMLSDLDWTIVRSAALREGPLTGIYRVVEGNAVPKGTHVSRADLAALLLKCAQGSVYVRKAVAVSY